MTSVTVAVFFSFERKKKRFSESRNRGTKLCTTTIVGSIYNVGLVRVTVTSAPAVARDLPGPLRCGDTRKPVTKARPLALTHSFRSFGRLSVRKSLNRHSLSWVIDSHKKLLWILHIVILTEGPGSVIGATLGRAWISPPSLTIMRMRKTSKETYACLPRSSLRNR